MSSLALISLDWVIVTHKRSLTAPAPLWLLPPPRPGERRWSSIGYWKWVPIWCNCDSKTSGTQIPLSLGTEWHSNSTATGNRVPHDSMWHPTWTRFDPNNNQKCFCITFNCHPKTADYHIQLRDFKQENALAIQVRQRCIHGLQKELHSYMVAQHSGARIHIQHVSNVADELQIVHLSKIGSLDIALEFQYVQTCKLLH